MIIEQRWTLFGHILRLTLTSPPQLSMQQYYILQPTGRGAPRTTLPVQLDNTWKMSHKKVYDFCNFVHILRKVTKLHRKLTSDVKY